MATKIYLSYDTFFYRDSLIQIISVLRYLNRSVNLVVVVRSDDRKEIREFNLKPEKSSKVVVQELSLVVVLFKLPELL